jgi:hypothetical protein
LHHNDAAAVPATKSQEIQNIMSSTQPASFDSVTAWLSFSSMTQAVFTSALQRHYLRLFFAWLRSPPFSRMTQVLVGERFFQACRNSDFFPSDARRLFTQELT